MLVLNERVSRYLIVRFAPEGSGGALECLSGVVIEIIIDILKETSPSNAMARSCSRARVTATCAPGARIASSALCDAKGGGTSAERARRVGRALGSNRFPFENHRRIRVACVRGTPGPRAARGIGIGHAPRPPRPPAFPARRPRAAIEGARHPSTEASRTGPPWCGTPTPHADGAAAVHCGGELSSSRRARRAAVVHLLRAAAYPSPFESNR